MTNLKTRRPRTGETRRTHQPLKIDQLPPVVHERILALRNRLGKTWEEIEAISAQPYDEKKTLVLVDWEKLPTEVLEQFPDRRLPRTSLHRWYDLRVSQVRRDVEQRSVIARQVADAFAKSVVKGSSEAVSNAARDTLMSMLSEDMSEKGRAKIVAGLIALAEIQQAARANDIRERKVSVDARKIKLLEDREKQARERLDKATQESAKKGTGQFSIEDINRLREMTFGLPPIPMTEAAHG